jgi:hypothetical protein
VVAVLPPVKNEVPVPEAEPAQAYT